MKTYRAHCALFYTVDDDSECTDASTHYVNLKSEVDAALAAKDAENNRIRHVLEQLLIDCNGKIRADHWNRAMSALEMNDAPPAPHPDTNRLDKLPQWQPMDSAPKDCNLLLVRRDPLSVTYGHWAEPEPIYVGDCGGPCRCPEYEDSGQPPGWWSEDGGFTAEAPPIAWMRPPDPPAREAFDAQVEPVVQQQRLALPTGQVTINPDGTWRNS